MNGLAIDQLPPELWLQIIEDRLHNEPDEFKALHNLRMTRRCCDTARELLEDRLQQTHFGKIEQVIATSTEDRRSRDSNLKRFLNSISRLPREFQSSAIFRFAPTEFRTFQLARTRNKTSKKVKDLDAKSGRNRLVNMQANFHNEGQVWMVDNTEAQLLLDLVGKCYHLKIEYNDSGDVAVVRKELYDESTVEERKLERLQAPMGILSEWMVETSNKKRTQRWVVNFFTKCAKAVSALFTTSGRVASTFFMYCGRFVSTLFANLVHNIETFLEGGPFRSPCRHFGILLAISFMTILIMIMITALFLEYHPEIFWPPAVQELFGPSPSQVRRNVHREMAERCQRELAMLKRKEWGVSSGFDKWRSHCCRD